MRNCSKAGSIMSENKPSGAVEILDQHSIEFNFDIDESPIKIDLNQ